MPEKLTARQIMVETCETMKKHVEKHPNLHGPGKMKYGSTASDYQGYLVMSHDAASHQRELDFWDERKLLYETKP